MNNYTIEQLEEGKTNASFEVRITLEMLEAFEQLSGDRNPLHRDVEYARSYGMKDRVAYGMLISAFYSRLVGMYLPGKFCILQEIKINFNKPVYPEDVLRVSGIVANKKELFKRVEIAAKIMNQEGSKVSSARIVVGVLDEI